MKYCKSSLITAGVLVSCLTLRAQTPANAALLQTIDGNDCAGVFGTPPNCEDPDGSPLIVKLNPNGTVDELGNFPTIDGSEFTITSTGQGTGTWTYTPNETEDPIVTSYVAKGGPAFNLFSNDGDPFSGDYFTPTNPSGNPAGLSHLSLYDTPVPEPVSILGSVAALGFGTVLKRQKNQKISNQ